eukprot:gene8919-18457_t
MHNNGFFTKKVADNIQLSKTSTNTGASCTGICNSASTEPLPSQQNQVRPLIQEYQQLPRDFTIWASWTTYGTSTRKFITRISKTLSAARITGIHSLICDEQGFPQQPPPIGITTASVLPAIRTSPTWNPPTESSTPRTSNTAGLAPQGYQQPAVHQQQQPPMGYQQGYQSCPPTNNQQRYQQNAYGPPPTETYHQSRGIGNSKTGNTGGSQMPNTAGIGNFPGAVQGYGNDAVAGAGGTAAVAGAGVMHAVDGADMNGIGNTMGDRMQSVPGYSMTGVNAVEGYSMTGVNAVEGYGMTGVNAVGGYGMTGVNAVGGYGMTGVNAVGGYGDEVGGVVKGGVGVENCCRE